MINFECQFWGVFFRGFGCERIPGSVVGCAENIANTVVFIRFHFFTYLVNCMISNRLLDVFLLVFWVPWIHFFWCLQVWGVGLKIDDFRGVAWRSPGWGNEVRWGLNLDRRAHYQLIHRYGWYGCFVAQVNCWYGSLFYILRTWKLFFEPLMTSWWLTGR